MRQQAVLAGLVARLAGYPGAMRTVTGPLFRSQWRIPGIRCVSMFYWIAP
jgi:hypothetical protein